MLTTNMNVYVFHRDKFSAQGWWVYVAVRLVLVSFLIWTIVRFPVREVGSGVRRPAGQAGPRVFDPLMGLRALACLLVLMGHYFMVVFPLTTSGVWAGRVARLLRSSPWAGVWIFFTLSGFLMGKAFASGRYDLNEAGARQFLRNRWLRIAPVYYFGLLLVTVLRYPQVLEWRNWWMVLEVCLFDYRGDLPINPMSALWSVSTEVQFYLLVPMIMVLLLLLRRVAGAGFVMFPLVVLIAGTILRLKLDTGMRTMYTYGYAPLIPNLDMFVFGMSLNLVGRWRPGPAIERWRGLVLVGSSIVFLGVIGELTTGSLRRYVGPLDQYWVKIPPLCVLFAGGFIYLAEMGGSFSLGAGLRGRVLLSIQWIGTLTYCLYVFHSEVFLASNLALSPASERYTLGFDLMHLPLVALETLGIALFFYLMVERPFDRKKKVGTSGLMDAP